MTPRWRGRWVAFMSVLLPCMVFSGCAGLVRFDGEGGAGRHVRARPSAAASSSHAGFVVVHSGDTLYSIAFRNDLDYRQLARWNGIGSDYTIYPGQRLRLTPPPGYGRNTPAAPAPRPTPPAPGRGPSPPLPVAAGAGAPTPPITSTGSTAEPLSPPAGSAVFDPRHWQWPTRGTVSTRFSVPKEKGIDISGRYGQDVVAAAPGTVVYSGNALKGYGELIIIKHSDDYLSAYGFNSRRLVQEGQRVRAGQLIAQMGEGPGQKPELHFEIRYKGRPVDPLKYLSTQ